MSPAADHSSAASTAEPARGWRTAAAAIAVAAVVGGSVGVGLWVDGRRDPGGGSPEGTVPSVFAHTRESATALLEGRGLDVRHRETIGCDPEGRPVGTDPATGTPVRAGDTVTLLLAHQGSNTDCAADLREPWRFMDFATGRGPAPAFAEQVEMFVDGRLVATMPGAQAGLGAWGQPSALTLLRDAAGRLVRDGDQPGTPRLEVREGTPPDAFCSVPRPGRLGEREALTLTLALPGSGAGDCPVRVALYRDGGGIDAVVAWSGASGRSAPSSPVPDVVGETLAKARAEVTGAGFTARVERQQTCAPRPGVVEQAPTQRDLEKDAEDDPDWSRVVTLVVEVPHGTRDCAALDAAAEAFLRFSRGGPAPAWSPRVQQLLGYALRDTVPAERADDPDAWSLCSGLTPSRCGLSPLVVAGAGPVATGETRDSSECELIDEGGLPSGLAPEDQIVLFPADPPDCESDWSVWLWIDREGRISAVNLLVSR